MKILLIGQGGREHALAEALRRSPQTEQLFCAPGSDALASLGECVDLAADDVEALARFAQEQSIDLTVVGPEAPLVKGLADHFASRGLLVFGPQKAAAALEGSKVFTKNLLRKYRIPTAEYRTFDDAREALRYIEPHRFPVVLKADGLASGKGVIIAEELAAAREAVERIMLRREFGDAGRRLVVEEFLQGEEASVMVFTDGSTIMPLEAAKDHKAVFDGDAGPNTGGMGAYCPSPLIQGDLYTRIEQDILIPVLHALNRERIPYRGVLYAGLMVTEQGPRVLEFNVRLGDPEAQVVLPRLRTDLVAIAQKTAEGHLEEIGSVEYTPEVALTVVLASEGYPGKPVVGRKITGLAAAAAVPGVTLYHSGTRLEDGEWYTTGGRVLGVTALAPDLESARESAYEAVGHIRFQGMHFRRDIGVRRGTR